MYVDVNEMKRQLLELRVNTLCVLLPQIARAIGVYNKELKAQGIDRATRRVCIKTLSDSLLLKPTEDKSTGGADCD